MTDRIVARARRLRRDVTEAEKRLWQLLRSRTLGVKFRRQHPIGPYVVDFCAVSAFLVVELDCGQHALPTPFEIERTRIIEAEGYRLLRFWNHDVLENAEGVMLEIVDALSPPRAAES